MTAFLKALSRKPLILDGALGTELENAFPPGSALQVKGNPLWLAQILISDPLAVQNVHYGYIKAGADIVLTSTYQASFAGITERQNLNLNDTITLWQRLVDLVKNLAKIAASEGNSRAVYIAGSIGAYGAYLANGSEYTGKYGDLKESCLYDHHYPLAKFFVENVLVDLVAFETIPSFAEFKDIVRLMHSLAVDGNSKPFYVSFTFKDKSHISDGTHVDEVLKYIHESRSEFPSTIGTSLFAIGCNCVAVDVVSEIIATISSLQFATDTGIVVYPNHGGSFDTESDSFSFKEGEMLKWRDVSLKWLQNPRISIIGGCCSTGTKEISILRQVVDEERK